MHDLRKHMRLIVMVSRFLSNKMKTNPKITIIITLAECTCQQKSHSWRWVALSEWNRHKIAFIFIDSFWYVLNVTQVSPNLFTNLRDAAVYAPVYDAMWTNSLDFTMPTQNGRDAPWRRWTCTRMEGKANASNWNRITFSVRIIFHSIVSLLLNRGTFKCHVIQLTLCAQNILIDSNENTQSSESQVCVHVFVFHHFKMMRWQTLSHIKYHKFNFFLCRFVWHVETPANAMRLK